MGMCINFNGFSVYDVIGNQQAASHTLTGRKQLVELFLQLCIILNGDMKMWGNDMKSEKVMDFIFESEKYSASWATLS